MVSQGVQVKKSLVKCGNKDILNSNKTLPTCQREAMNGSTPASSQFVRGAGRPQENAGTSQSQLDSIQADLVYSKLSSIQTSPNNGSISAKPKLIQKK